MHSIGENWQKYTCPPLVHKNGFRRFIVLNKEDINKYNTTQMTGRPMGRTDGEMARSAGATAQTVLSM